jgi:8-oxo-dGTP pyrophosphatase MutT (NUDIX family)
VILVSPSLEILLLHRVQTSSSFPSAHVFPGGNIDKQDGHIPEEGMERQKDNQAYRVGALRELFEESGILLARQRADTPPLVSIHQTAREEGRKLVHSGKMPFQAWLNEQHPDSVLDTDGLIPFSRWITPPNIPRRFTTQMYLYILPQPSNDSTRIASDPPAPDSKQPTADFTPVSDDSLENTSATFSRAHVWLSRAQSGEIILFPPQFLLLHLISQFLDDESLPPSRRIEQLREFIHRKEAGGDGDGEVSWTEKCISPYALTTPSTRADGKVVLGLDKPGPEVEELRRGGSGLELKLTGDRERVVLVKFRKEGPRELEVRWRSEVMEESRRGGRSGSGRREDGPKL